MKKLLLLLFGALIIWACEPKEEECFRNDELSEVESQSPLNLKSLSTMDMYGGDEITSEYLDRINERLAMKDENYRVVMAEYITLAGSNEAGQTVRSKDVGNKQLEDDFVPNDDRRVWSGSSVNDITYAIDKTVDALPPFGGLSAAETDAAIEQATGTWQNMTCSELNLTRNPDYDLDIGYVAYIYGLGGSPFIFGDVQHAGFRDINFGLGIVGVTFTFVFTDENDNYTDIDNNRKNDVAFREIYYDPSYPWADDGIANVDLESIALHELGHGLSQGYFGSIVYKNDGTLKASPRAVMNPLYFQPFRELKGTDKAGHCSIWAQWPYN